MEIKKVYKADGKLKVWLGDVELGFVNALRRICIESVPVLAIDEVEFVKNDSVLYDEIIAHRLGLVPLKTDLRTIKSRETCDCKGKGCNKCTITLKLQVKGKEVFSSDLKNKAIDIPFEMPITKLTEEQELELQAFVCLGIGKEHAKFIPGLVWHTYVPENFNADKPDLKIITEESGNMKFKKDQFIFHIESWGQLEPEEIFLSGLDVLQKKLKELDKSLGKI